MSAGSWRQHEPQNSQACMPSLRRTGCMCKYERSKCQELGLSVSMCVSPVNSILHACQCFIHYQTSARTNWRVGEDLYLERCSSWASGWVSSVSEDGYWADQESIQICHYRSAFEMTVLHQTGLPRQQKTCVLGKETQNLGMKLLWNMSKVLALSYECSKLIQSLKQRHVTLSALITKS